MKRIILILFFLTMFQFSTKVAYSDNISNRKIVLVRLAIASNGQMPTFISVINISDLYRRKVWQYIAKIEMHGRTYNFLVRPKNDKEFFFMMYQREERVGANMFGTSFSGFLTTDMLGDSALSINLASFTLWEPIFFHINLHVFSDKESLALVQNLPDFQGTVIGEEIVCDQFNRKKYFCD